MAVWWLASKETASALLRAEAANCRAAVLSMFVCVEDWRSGCWSSGSISKLVVASANQTSGLRRRTDVAIPRAGVILAIYNVGA